MSAELANLLGQSGIDPGGTPNPITAAGTTQGTATTLNASNSIVTAASSAASGVVIPIGSSRTRLFFVQNSPSSSVALNVYPYASARMAGQSAINLPVSIPIGGFGIFDTQSLSFIGAVTSAGSTAGGVIPVAGQSASPRTIAIGDLVPAVSTDFNDSTPVITEVYVGEILVPMNTTVTGIALFNGSNVTGNVKAGLYDSTGALVAQTASTAGVGVDAYQRIAFTAPYAALGPATYYIANSFSSATARYNSPPLGNFGASVTTAQVFGTLPLTITPPTTFTTIVSPIASLY